MKDIEREQSLIRQYLLGELDESHRELLEQRVITNPDYKEEVLITEEELLEDFVSGTLSQRELELFTKTYSSSPDQWRKVKVAKAFNEFAINHPLVSQPMVCQKSRVKSLIEFFYKRKRLRQYSLAALITVLVLGGSLLYWWISQERRVNYEALLLLNGPDSEILQPADSVVSVSLPPLLFRGPGEPRSITITGQTKTVQLQLADPSVGTHWFRASLKDSAATEVFRLEDLRARQLGQHSLLVLQIPARMLTSQDYQLEISEKRADGTYEDPATYSLHVEAVR